jgi:putative NADH-flavin reductase
MKTKTTVAIIGGTGKTGRYLLKKIINEPINIKALVRKADPFSMAYVNLHTMYGDVKDYAIVQSLIRDCDAVISTLGLGTPPDEPTLFGKATHNILKAMDHHQVRRYIAITGLNVDTTFDHKSEKTKSATAWMYEHFPISTRDRQLEYELLNKSSIDWTLVRLPLIEQTDLVKEISTSLEDCPSDTISAGSLAEFLIQQLYDTSFIKTSPFIGNKQ